MPFPILEFPDQPAKHLPDDWWNSIKTFLRHHNSQLRLTKDVVLVKSLRENDISLMLEVNKNTNITPTDRETFNQVRLYL